MGKMRAALLGPPTYRHLVINICDPSSCNNLFFAHPIQSFRLSRSPTIVFRVSCIKGDLWGSSE